MPRTVLVVWSSHLQDPSVPAVCEALERRGCCVVGLDSAGLPLGANLSLGLAEDPAHTYGWLETGSQRVALDDIDAVWLRHTDVAMGVQPLIDAAHFSAVRAQATAHLWDLLACLPHALHIDRLAHLRAVPGPTAMLRLARLAGLTVPRTLVSNDPGRVAAFLDACEGRAIQKMLDSSATRVPRPGGPDYLPTLRVTEEHRANLDRVAVCPMVFQEEVEKEVELRVMVVGDRLFTGAVPSKGTVDWRQHPDLIGRFVPWDLDPAVALAILRLMDALQLQTGSVDLIVRPDGQHVFLEVNTISFFDFLEAATGLPIADATAALLAGETLPR
jgi:hypothetical protein